MSDFQAALQRVANMNRVAQEALPVLPNNGNPGGVYNMPRDVVNQQQQQAVTPAQPVDRFPWLKASESLANIRQRAQALRPNQQQQTTQQQVVVPIMNGYV